MIVDNYSLKELRRAFGKELFSVRQRRGVSLYHMANKIHMERRQLDRVELGKPVHIYTILRILRYCGCKCKIELID